MESIYMLADCDICKRIGQKIKATRLKQNITQQSLAASSLVPLSTLKRIEAGKLGSFDSLLRLIRTLGMLEHIRTLVEEDELSPREYADFVYHTRGKQRKRAVNTIEPLKVAEPEW